MSTLIDFADPRTDGAQRLRLAFGAPSRTLVARSLAEVRPVLAQAEALARAEARSRELHRAEYAALDLPHGRYLLAIGADPVNYALAIDLAGTVPWRDWPMNPQQSPVRLSLQRDGQQLVLQPGWLP